MAFSLQSFTKLFKKGGSSVLGVDIGSSAIKVVQLKKDKGKAVLETYGEIALGPYIDKPVGQAVKTTNEVLVSALSDLIGEAKVTTKNAGVSVPLSASLISLIEVPALSEEKLQTMIPIEARKYIPVPISEVLLDWYPLPQAPGKEGENSTSTEVLIVAIHKDRISQFQQISTSAKLETSFFEIEAFSTARSVLDRGIQPKLIIDLGASSTKIYIAEAGIIKDSHVINQGAQDITRAIAQADGSSFEEAEEKKRMSGEEITKYSSNSLNYIFSEVHRIVLQYQQKYNRSVVESFLTGGGSLLTGIQEIAQEKLDSSVVISDPFAKIQTPAFLEEVLKNAGPEFAVAIGVALRKLDELG